MPRPADAKPWHDHEFVKCARLTNSIPHGIVRRTATRRERGLSGIRYLAYARSDKSSKAARESEFDKFTGGAYIAASNGNGGPNAP